MGLLGSIAARLFTPKLDLGSYCDDTYLRKLASEYEAGKTKWVFASDMAEYFRFVDRHNLEQRGPEGNPITVKLALDINATLIAALNNGQHLSEKRNHHEVMGVIGPAFVEGFAISYGKHVYPATYQYTGIDSFLVFELPNGSTKKYNFGIVEHLRDAAVPQPATP